MESYTWEISRNRFLDYFREKDIELKIDTTPFSRALVVKIMLDGGAIPVPERYLDSCVPPLTAIPLDWEPNDHGILYRKNPSDTVQQFLDVAKRFFAERK